MHNLAAANIPELFSMDTLNLLTDFSLLDFNVPIGLKAPAGVPV